jgi:hypothetical protein
MLGIPVSLGLFIAGTFIELLKLFACKSFMKGNTINTVAVPHHHRHATRSRSIKQRLPQFVVSTQQPITNTRALWVGVS